MLAELEEVVFPLIRRIGAFGKQQTFVTYSFGQCGKGQNSFSLFHFYRGRG